MTPSIARRLAWVLVFAYVILAAIGLSLQGLTRAPFGPNSLPMAVILVTLVGVWIVTGTLIISRHPRHPVGWLLCVGLFSPALDMFSAGYAAYAAYEYTGSLPGVALTLIWLKLANLAPLALVAFTLIVLLFPDGRLPSPGWRKLVWVTVGTLCLFLPLQAVEPGAIRWGFLPLGANPLAVHPTTWGYLGPWMWAAFSVLVLCFWAGIASLILRLRASSGDVRQQVKWLLPPAVLWGIFLLLFLIGLAEADNTIIGLSIAVGQLAAACIVIAIAFAIFRHRLYDIDIIINRTLVYGTLTACVAVFYALIVGGAGLVMQTNANLAGLVVTVILVGAIYRPMLVFLQAGVDHLLQGTGGAASNGWFQSLSNVEADRNKRQERQRLDPADAFRLPPATLWMKVARLAWYPTFAIALGIFLPAFFNNTPLLIASIRYSGNPLPSIGRGLLLLAGLVSLLMALLIFRYRSSDRMGLFISFFLLLYGIINSGALEALKPIFPMIFRYTEITLPGIVAVLTLVLFAVFPDGQFVPPWTRWVVWAAFLSILLLVIRSSLYFPSTIEFSQPGDMIFTLIIFVLVIVGWISTFYAQVYRYHYISTPQQRQQTKWVLYGMGATFGLQMFLGMPWLFGEILPFGFPFPWWQAVSSMLYLLGVSVPILPVTLTIAVMRYRLYDIDIIFNRTLVYGALTAIVAAFYVGIVGVVGTLLQTQGNLLITLLTTGLIAVLFQPLRERLQRTVNRLLYGERDDPIEALSRLGKQMEVALPTDQVLPALVKTIAQTLKLPYVGITLKGERDISFGQATDNSVAFPFIFQGETTGVLLASPRNPGDQFTPGEMRLLQNLARQAGAAVRNARLSADLQRSRQTLVTAREEERHRLRRDLHDGIGPTMAGLTLKLDAAKDLVSSGLETGKREDLEEAVQLLIELKTQTQETVQNIRHIVHTLRPPALDVLGLAPALQAHFAQVGTPRNLKIRMAVTPRDFPRLSAAVEVAAYHIVLEAVTNVIQHAQADRCIVSLTLDNEKLKLKIEDDGVGLPKARFHGIGLNSMRERAEELGGWFELSSSPHGTHVCAEIPIAPARKEP